MYLIYVLVIAIILGTINIVTTVDFLYRKTAVGERLHICVKELCPGRVVHRIEQESGIVHKQL